MEYLDIPNQKDFVTCDNRIVRIMTMIYNNQYSDNNYHYGIFEIHCSALVVSKSAVIKQLKQYVENIRMSFFYLFFFNDTATTEIYTLSLHDALPI